MSPPWAMVQYDDRILDPEIQIFVARNKEYCDKHGYTYIFEKKKYDTPPHWIKVKLVQELLRTNKYKGIIWIDTDAVVHNLDKSLDDLLVDEKSFYHSLEADVYGTPFNAGVWMVLNNKMGNEIMDKWMDVYPTSNWSHKNGKWVTGGAWAGVKYEQGGFVEYVKPLYPEHIHVYDWRVFQSYDPHETTFTMHFSGPLKAGVHKYLPHIQKKEGGYHRIAKRVKAKRTRRKTRHTR